MTDRDRLIEVLGEFDLCPSKMKYVWMPKGIEKLADHLIANGVTFAKDNNVPSKWVPVTERLPESGQMVLTIGRTTQDVLWFVSDIRSVDRYLSKHKKPGFLMYDSEYGYVEAMHVTHWMPLPEPPKGEE